MGKHILSPIKDWNNVFLYSRMDWHSLPHIKLGTTLTVDVVYGRFHYASNQKKCVSLICQRIKTIKTLKLQKHKILILNFGPFSNVSTTEHSK